MKAISANGSFLLWMPKRLSFKHFLFISEGMPDEAREIFHHFSKETVIDSVTNNFSRQYGDKIIFFENIDSVGLKIVQDKLKEMKKEFYR
jgi:hypothetical protein